MKRAAILIPLLLLACVIVVFGGVQARSADDLTAPTGTVTLPALVGSPDVLLVIDVADAESGLEAVRARDEGQAWSDWAPLPAAGASGHPELAWRLPGGDGSKTVVVEVRNGAGLVASFTASTVLDTTAPTLVSSVPAGGAVLTAPPALFVLHYSETLAVTPLPTALLPGGPALSAAVLGGDVRLTPATTVQPGDYTLAVDGVRDPAGNQTSAAAIGFTVQRPTPTLTLSASQSVVIYGTYVTLKGRLSAGARELTVLRKRLGEADFTRIGSVTSGADGRFSYRFRPSATATFKVAFAGDARYAPVEAHTSVKVRPRVVFVTPTAFWLGKRVTLKGAVGPSHPGAEVVIKRYVNRQWVTWQTIELNDRSRFALSWKPSKAGSYRLRLTMAADELHLLGASKPHRIVVSPPNPHHVSVMFAHFIVVDLSQCRLYYYEHGRVIRSFNCVVGKPSTPTPVGQWPIYQKVVGMWGPYGPFTMWYHAPYHFGIHGTNEPWLLNRFPRYYSHGCTRLANANISWLFPRVPVGTQVRNIR